VADFKEDQLEVLVPKNLSGRARRSMVVYYNVLNILGDRMGKSPSSTITLVGSSEKGPEDGREMAESIKRYLVSTFDIAGSRISIEGRDKPKIPSEQPGSTVDLGMLRAGDRRVTIESGSSALLMEFQTGPNASLKPVEVNARQEAPLDSYITVNANGANEAFTSWVLEVEDGNRRVQNFGPYTQEKVRLPGKSILGTRSEGKYKMTMIGQTKSGKTVRKSTTTHMVLWTPPENEQGMRYSVIYEFDESKAINIYDKYLTDIVVPKIPQGAMVIIHGYTDIIGDANYNQNLSLARANDVKGIIAAALAKAGRSDVMLEVYGFGEDETVSPFENNFPEERFYNRTVLIDIIPVK
jgi:outer membrane protein OmpA-like peptidoglycan-associated protein